MAGSPFHKDDEAAPIADVNVVPLADVSLVLLIILLVLSPMAAQSMLKVQTAAAKSSVAPPTQVELLTQREPTPATCLGKPRKSGLKTSSLPRKIPGKSWASR